MENNKINISSSLISSVINTAENDGQNKRQELIENYEELVILNIKNLKRIIENETNKSFIMYNVGLLLELFYKMVLIEDSAMAIEKIGELNHNLSEIYKNIEEKCNNNLIKSICEKIKRRASLIKMSNGNGINYNNYHDFRYNHEIGDYNLLFIDKINDKDIKYIKEVLECIESIMR